MNVAIMFCPDDVSVLALSHVSEHFVFDDPQMGKQARMYFKEDYQVWLLNRVAYVESVELLHQAFGSGEQGDIANIVIDPYGTDPHDTSAQLEFIETLHERMPGIDVCLYLGGLK